MNKVISLSAALLMGGATFALAENAAPSRDGGYGLGRTALPEEIAAWDIDVRPDGLGLPVGSGDVFTGEELWIDNCSACHGDFGEARGRWPVIAGGFGTLQGEDPNKTVGSYWPYLSTVWDYVHRAMPYGNAQSLSNDEVYAIVAYIMYSNDLVDDDFELSNENFLEVRLPNEENFFMDDRAEVELPMFSEAVCMENCAESVEITARAAVLDVTPETEGDAAAAEVVEVAAAAEEAAPAETGPSPELIAAGEEAFRACRSCHQVGEGARNGAGPQLNGIYMATAAHAEGFRYSPAFEQARADGLVWDDEALTAYLMDPRGYLPNNRMAFRGLRDAADAEAIIAYLRTEGGE